MKRTVHTAAYGDVILERYENPSQDSYHIKVTVQGTTPDSYILDYEDVFVRDATFKCIEPDVLTAVIDERAGKKGADNV